MSPFTSRNNSIHKVASDGHAGRLYQESKWVIWGQMRSEFNNLGSIEVKLESRWINSETFRSEPPTHTWHISPFFIKGGHMTVPIMLLWSHAPILPVQFILNQWSDWLFLQKTKTQPLSGLFYSTASFKKYKIHYYKIISFCKQLEYHRSNVANNCRLGSS